MAEQQQQGEKNTWPELVGLEWEEAEKAIRKIYPKMSIQVVPEDSMVITDHRTDRVRIFTTSDNKVAKPPKIG